jgi:hypothetical protein
MNTRTAWFTCVLLAGCCDAPPTTSSTSVATRTGSMPLIEVLDTWHRGAASKDASAQRFVDQGLTLVFGFQHEAAVRSFARARSRSPSAERCPPRGASRR